MMRPIRLLVADNHPLLRLGLHALLHQAKNQHLEIISEVNSGHKAVTETARLQPDMVLLETDLPDLDGAEVTRQILRFLPKTRIIILTASEDSHQIVECMRAGVMGYLSKAMPLSELLNGILSVAGGQPYFSKDLSSIVNGQPTESQPMMQSSNGLVNGQTKVLTKRELEILHLVAEEKSNQEIAEILFVSPRTVETHKRNMLLKLKMKNVAGLVKYYLQRERAGLVG